MTCARTARLGLAFAAALLPAVAQAQSFVLMTQNMLRFGHGSRLENQCKAIAKASLKVDIIVLQEVMTNGYPCIGTNNNNDVDMPVPANFRYVTSPAKGEKYVEYYGILYRYTPRNNIQITNPGNKVVDFQWKEFIRPPYAVFFNVKSKEKTCKVWVVDFHSIFGKKIEERQKEVKEMGKVYTYLMGRDGGKVIMAGDWNLPTVDLTGFDWVANKPAKIDPNVLTSLTRDGTASSAYDHAINTFAPSNSPVTINEPSSGWVYVGTSTSPPSPSDLAEWRAKVSDHMGVIGDVTLRC